MRGAREMDCWVVLEWVCKDLGSFGGLTGTMGQLLETVESLHKPRLQAHLTASAG